MKLDEYLFRTRKTQTAFAEELGIQRQYFNSLVRGRRVPGRYLARKIEKATNGQVTVLELLFPEEETHETQA